MISDYLQYWIDIIISIKLIPKTKKKVMNDFKNHFIIIILKKMNDACKLSFDNATYSKDIPESELNSYTENEYEEYTKKMDIHLLHTVSEQRCRPFGCRLEGCLQKFMDINKCMQLYRLLNNCIEKERRKCIYEFIKTGKQKKF